MKSAADRGKWAEEEAQKFLKKFTKEVDRFDWQRMPDARAARGMLAAQVADFEIFKPFDHGVLEVKETEHTFRLAKDKLSQLPRMRLRHNAGGHVLVLVHHSDLGKWRLPPATEFFNNPTAASWDLSRYPLFLTAEEALRQHPFFA